MKFKKNTLNSQHFLNVWYFRLRMRDYRAFAIASAVDNAAAVGTMKPKRSDEERTAEKKRFSSILTMCTMNIVHVFHTLHTYTNL